MVNKFVAIIFMFLLFSCTILNSKKIKLSRNESVYELIQTDGFYRYNWVDDTTTSYWICLYKNGVFLNCGTYSNSDNNAVESINSINNNKYFKNSKYWGYYTINNDSIFMYYPNIVKLAGPFLQIMRFTEMKGKIIESNYFVIDQYVNKNEVRKVNEAYYFYSCRSCKPDASNWLLNKLKE